MNTEMIWNTKRIHKEKSYHIVEESFGKNLESLIYWKLWCKDISKYGMNNHLKQVKTLYLVIISIL